MSKYTAEQVLEAATTLQNLEATLRGDIEDIEQDAIHTCIAIAEEYAAHLAAQAEWPSDALHTAASVRAELVSKIGDCCQGGDPLCAGGCHVEEAAKRNAALQSVRPPAVPMESHTISVKSCDGEWEGEARWEHQEQAYVTQGSVRPPVGAVSDEDVRRACTAYVICANPDDDDEPVSYVPARIRAALESYASRHAPTKD